MKVKTLHSWNLTPKDAIRVQKELSVKISLKNKFSKIRYIAGMDISLPNKNEGIAGVIVYSFPDLKVVEKQKIRMNLDYPYIPGLLSFRESPVLIRALEKIGIEPDLLIFDGHGIAHPRGIGIASHMGLLLDKPTIGCAKSHLVGQYDEPGVKKGSTSPLLLNDKRIGTVLRTRDAVKPIFISPGHHIDFKSSIGFILKCLSGYRIPLPTRDADHYVKILKKEPKKSFVV